MAEENKNPNPEKGPAPRKPVLFHHVRMGPFRSIHADGAWASINGLGNITLAFFNERPPLPKSVTYEYGESGQFVPTKEALTAVPDNEVLRQFEAEVIMSLESAKRIHTLLGNFIKIKEESDTAQK
jgi:sulfite reductase alpha subunit-like flavoprotein